VLIDFFYLKKVNWAGTGLFLLLLCTENCLFIRVYYGHVFIPSVPGRSVSRSVWYISLFGHYDV